MATVLLSSEPVSIILRHNGMISVVSRKLMTSEESFLTRAPMTPRDVRRRYSKGLDFEVVLRNGYKKSGMCAGTISISTVLVGTQHIPLRKSARVSLCEATHCRSASALQTRFEAAAVSCDGLRSVYTEIIS